MEQVKHAMLNIPDDQRETFMRELSSIRNERTLELLREKMTAPFSATPCQHKPNKAEKKRSKRERREAYGSMY